jgi:hypothetical protein
LRILNVSAYRPSPSDASWPVWVAWIADARPLPRYVDILTDAGLRITDTEQHDEAPSR